MWNLFRTGRSATRRLPKQRTRLGLNCLETRCVMSTAAIVDNELIIHGTKGDDVIEVRAYIEPDHELQGKAPGKAADQAAADVFVGPLPLASLHLAVGSNHAGSGSPAGIEVPPVAGKAILPAPYATVIANGEEIGRFDLSWFEDVQMYGGAGDDRLSVSGAIKSRVYLDGGDGNDVLFIEADKSQSGGGEKWFQPPTTRSILQGGDGDDFLAGSDGVDMLIGGAGQDTLRGLGGDDLLIGGATLADGDTKVLFSLFSTWNSNEVYGDRIEMFLNEVSALIPYDMDAVFAFSDGSADYLEGGEGQDWFYAGFGSKIADLAKDEIVE